MYLYGCISCSCSCIWCTLCTANVIIPALASFTREEGCAVALSARQLARRVPRLDMNATSLSDVEPPTRCHPPLPSSPARHVSPPLPRLSSPPRPSSPLLRLFHITPRATVFKAAPRDTFILHLATSTLISASTSSLRGYDSQYSVGRILYYSRYVYLLCLLSVV